MAQRINISIPDELHAELDKWRNQLNVSGICQEALRKEVARLEAVGAAGDDLDAVVERLRQEKEKWERHWYERGIQLGREWARRSSYRELVEWASPERDVPKDVLDARLFPGFPRRGVYLDKDDADRLLDAYPTLRHVLAECLASEDPAEEDVLVCRAEEYNAERLSAGWVKGVRDFWNQIKDAL